MTTPTYIADIGAERAAQFAATYTDFHANGIKVHDLGDGRIKFGQDALDLMRDYTPDDNGYITDDDNGLRMWVDGMPCPIKQQHTGPVRARPSTDEIEFDRAEWDAATPAERREWLDNAVWQAIDNAGGGGYHLLDETDWAALDDEPAVDRPAEDTASEVLAALRAEFSEAHASGASSNDITQILDDFLTVRGLPTVLYAKPPAPAVADEFVRHTCRGGRGPSAAIRNRGDHDGGYPSESEIRAHFAPGGPHTAGACGPVCTFGDR
jgi:hypothetical protein